jgi:predicted O-methyltransferase YrrM
LFVSDLSLYTGGLFFALSKNDKTTTNLVRNTLMLANSSKSSQSNLSLSKPRNYIQRQSQRLATKLDNQQWETRLKIAGVQNVGQIFTYTQVAELRALYEICSGLPEKAIALEIGSHLGASTCYITAGLKNINGHLLCVDTWNNETMPEGMQNTFAEFQKNTSGVSDLITPVRKLSSEIQDSDIMSPLDFVFIDGDHSYKGAKSDFEKIEPFMSEDGIIAFHDCCLAFEGVVRTIGEALSSGKWILVDKVQSLTWIKRAKWQPTIFS